MSGLPPLLDLLPLLAIGVGIIVLLLVCASAMRHARMLADALQDLSVDHARVCTGLVALRADCRQLPGELELWQAGLYGEGRVPPEVRISQVSQVDPFAPGHRRRIDNPKDLSR